MYCKICIRSQVLIKLNCNDVVEIIICNEYHASHTRQNIKYHM